MRVRIDKPDVGRQRHRHAYEPVFQKVRVVARAFSVLAKIVGIRWTEQRIVRARFMRPLSLQRGISRLRGCRRELEILRGHVTVGARTSVAAELLQVAFTKRRTSARDGIAW